MDQILTELAKSSPTAAVIGLVVWWTMRDQGSTLRAIELKLGNTDEHSKILRSIDLRMAKMLERTRATPTYGSPTSGLARARSRNDSDEDQVSVPRTTSQDLEDGDADRDADQKKRDR